MNLLKIVFVLLSVTVQAAAQVVYLPSDSLIFEKCMQAMDINKCKFIFYVDQCR